MDTTAKTTLTMFPRYPRLLNLRPDHNSIDMSPQSGSLDFKSNSRIYGDIPVVKLADPLIETKHPSFLDLKWNDMVDDPKSEQHSIQESQTFWFDNPGILLQTFDLLPQPDMNNAERLNAMTRAIIVISAVMFLIQFPLWWLFLALGLLVVVALWQLVKGHETLYHQREYLRRPRSIIKPVNPVIRPFSRTKEPGMNIIARIQ